MERIINKKNILSILSYFLILQFLLTNWGVERIGSIIHQTTEWETFNWRGVALVVLGIILYFVSGIIREKSFYYAIETACIIESIYALCQVYGIVAPINTIYKLTGTFYNSGPLGGYLALGIVIATSEYLSIDRMNKWRSSILEIAILIMGCVLFATLSRTAWFATAVGLVWVYIHKKDWKQIVLRNKKHFILGGIIGICSLLCVLYLKWQSALGRLLLWRISWRAMMNSPIIGNESFEKAYGQALESYFGEGKYANWEIDVCDNTDKSFCEYLNFGVQYGLVALLCLIVLLYLIMWLGTRQKQHGLVGLQLTFMCFAIASYPMHFPAFAAIEVMIVCYILFKNVSKWTIFGVGCFMIPLLCYYGLYYNKEKNQIKEMDIAHHMYSSAQYLKAANLYSCVANIIPNKREFWYEYGHSLHKV